jgi:hypothetical protein
MPYSSSSSSILPLTFCPEIELRKNIRRKVKRTKAILGNGEDHCGATAQWNALAAGWGDKDVRQNEAMKGDGLS